MSGRKSKRTARTSERRKGSRSRTSCTSIVAASHRSSGRSKGRGKHQRLKQEESSEESEEESEESEEEAEQLGEEQELDAWGMGKTKSARRSNNKR